jgi:hypothetical protein
MKRFGVIPVLLASCLALQAGGVLAYEVPETIQIQRPEKNAALAQWVGPRVEFPHGFHAVRNACNKCHHKESDKDLGKFLSCTQCHSKDDPNDNTGFYLAWHNDSVHSCLGCHRKVRLEDAGKMPPLSCTNGCHKKQ